MKECLSPRIYELENEREGREGKKAKLKLLSSIPFLKVAAQI